MTLFSWSFYNRHRVIVRRVILLLLLQETVKGFLVHQLKVAKDLGVAKELGKVMRFVAPTSRLQGLNDRECSQTMKLCLLP